MQEIQDTDRVLFIMIQDMVYRDMWHLMIECPTISLSEYASSGQPAWFTQTGLHIASVMLRDDCNFVQAMKTLEMDISDHTSVHIGFAVQSIFNSFTLTFKP